MVDEKITDYTALTGASLATGDLFEMVDVSDTTMDATGTNKKMTAAELVNGMAALGLKRAYLVDEVHADAGSASSVAEQTLASLTLPAGIIAAGDILRCVFIGDRLNNSGGAANYTWRFKIGATTLHSTGGLALATGAARTGWAAEVDISFAATNAERAALQLVASNSASNPTVVQTSTAVMYGTAAEDSASALTVAFTCQLSVNNAATDVVLHAASMNLVKK